MLNKQDYIDILVFLNTSIQNLEFDKKQQYKLYSDNYYTNRIAELKSLYDRVKKVYMEC